MKTVEFYTSNIKKVKVFYYCIKILKLFLSFFYVKFNENVWNIKYEDAQSLLLFLKIQNVLLHKIVLKLKFHMKFYET